VTGRSPVIEGKYVAHALVLEPTGIAGKFRRIGLVEIPRVQGEELEGWMWRDVVIVLLTDVRWADPGLKEPNPQHVTDRELEEGGFKR
jgi:hypothetical protein